MQDKSIVILVRLDLVMALTLIMQVVEWKSVWMVYGVQCVVMAGTAMMPPQCADNWDTITVCITILYHDYSSDN